jgi:hypothetical protein
VLGGEGACRLCKGKIWDVFYVVSDEAQNNIKFGITSGDPRPRLRNHARQGYKVVVKLLTGLPVGAAWKLERSIILHLRQAGEMPERGREYFPARALPLILDIIDHHPAIRAVSPAVTLP